MLLLLAVVGNNGCTMMQWLQPHQIWKLNRQPPIGRNDAYFSIPPRPLLPSNERAEDEDVPRWVTSPY